MKKKILAIVIILTALIACAFGLGACYKTTTKDGLIIETLRFFDRCWVVGVENKDVTEIVIPAKYRNKTVTGINESAFSGCHELKKITIPESVSSIGSYAFSGCEQLTEITIPERVTKINDGTFNNCSGLTSVNIHDDITEIGVGAFKGCTGIIQTENGVEYVANWAVGHDNESITDEVTIRSDTKGLSNKLFQKCEKLTAITIPDSVTIVGCAIFYGCTNLTTVQLGNQMTSLPSYTYSEMMMGTYYEGFFEDCKSLTNITIPQSLTSIGDYAFKSCYGLKNVYYTGNMASWCENKILGKFMTSGLTIYVDGKELTGDLVIPNGVTAISNYAFYDCNGLTSIAIPDSVTSIGSYAFEGCYGLTSITVDINNTAYHSAGNCLIATKSKTLIAGCKNSIIPDDGSVTSIGDYAFADCRELTSVTIGNGVTSIGYNSFYGCNGLTSVTIDNSVTDINHYAFDWCSELTNITFNGTMEQWLAVEKRSTWNDHTGNFTVTCTDGKLDKDGTKITE